MLLSTSLRPHGSFQGETRNSETHRVFLVPDFCHIQPDLQKYYVGPNFFAWKDARDRCISLVNLLSSEVSQPPRAPRKHDRNLCSKPEPLAFYAWYARFVSLKIMLIFLLV